MGRRGVLVCQHQPLADLSMEVSTTCRSVASFISTSVEVEVQVEMEVRFVIGFGVGGPRPRQLGLFGPPPPTVRKPLDT